MSAAASTRTTELRFDRRPSPTPRIAAILFKLTPCQRTQEARMVHPPLSVSNPNRRQARVSRLTYGLPGYGGSGGFTRGIRGRKDDLEQTPADLAARPGAVAPGRLGGAGCGGGREAAQLRGTGRLLHSGAVHPAPDPALRVPEVRSQLPAPRLAPAACREPA